MRGGRLMAAGFLISLALAPAGALGARSSGLLSLYHGPGPRPGPSVLYAPPVVAPELTNAGIWHAPPILVSGATAYRRGEFLYQDWIFDDHGAREVADPNDPRASGDLFSKPNGTYTYPTGPGYDENAADLVEFRVKPTRQATAFRVTLNTLQKPRLMAFTIAIGGRTGHPVPFPFGANVKAPASLFLTVRPAGKQLVAELDHASGKPVGGRRPTVRIDRRRHQLTVLVPHSDWNPRRSTVRFAMGVGLWNPATGRYLLPQQTASATSPGGAGSATNPPAFFNVAFRSNSQEPMPTPDAGVNAIADARWWRDAAQGAALASGDISSFFVNVSFAKLWRGVNDNSHVPTTGPMDRLFSSHYAAGQGEQFANQCGIQGASNPASCRPEYLGQLQPYAIYVPKGPTPRGGWGLTLLLHSLSANYNQYTSTRNQSQFALRSKPAIVITPEARGPDQFYEGLGEADVFEVWNAVAHLYRLNPGYTDITGYSMGGFGTFDMGAQFPDLFARAQPTVGEETNNNVLPSLRNLPVLMWNVHGDELVNNQAFMATASKLEQLGYRVTLHAHFPCATTGSPLCSPVLPEHLELAINDWYKPAANFLGSVLVDRNPFHVTYVVDTARDSRRYGVVANHAYWVGGLGVRQSGSLGTFDALSRGFGLGDPAPSGTKNGSGTLVGGHLGPLHYTTQAQTWGPAPHARRNDSIAITATNIATAVINVARARVDCHVKLTIHSDGPIKVKLAGCARTVSAG